MADALADLVLVRHRDVVESLPSSIRNDFRELDAGELWRLPIAIFQWGELEPVDFR